MGVSSLTTLAVRSTASSRLQSTALAAEARSSTGVLAPPTSGALMTTNWRPHPTSLPLVISASLALVLSEYGGGFHHPWAGALALLDTPGSDHVDATTIGTRHRLVTPTCKCKSSSVKPQGCWAFHAVGVELGSGSGARAAGQVHGKARHGGPLALPRKPLWTRVEASGIGHGYRWNRRGR